MVDIDDGFLSLMEDSGEVRSDIKLVEDDVGKNIKKRFEDGDSFMVTILAACGEEAAVGVKTISS